MYGADTGGSNGKSKRTYTFPQLAQEEVTKGKTLGDVLIETGANGSIRMSLRALRYQLNLDIVNSVKNILESVPAVKAVHPDNITRPDEPKRSTTCLRPRGIRLPVWEQQDVVGEGNQRTAMIPVAAGDRIRPVGEGRIGVEMGDELYGTIGCFVCCQGDDDGRTEAHQRSSRRDGEMDAIELDSLILE
ncbi:hypothetical protein K440DRAFT_637198 [Wilcoxina mikolae CBS 423.85]|nr:hypothetical protein K440DRAFT_637198 [Wilcoxina mikolae CBS 423.85]